MVPPLSLWILLRRNDDASCHLSFRLDALIADMKFLMP